MGNYLSFDGVDDYVRIPIDKSFYDANFSFGIWINPKQGQNVRVVNNRGTGAPGTTQGGWQLKITSDTSQWNIYDTGVGDAENYYRIFESAKKYSINTWHYITFVYVNKTSLSIYVNGILDTEINVPSTIGSISSDLPTAIGASIVNQGIEGIYSQFYKGAVKDASLWQKALSDQEIQSIMNTNLIGTEEYIVGLWRFNEGTGDIVKDSTLYNTEGTINGATWVVEEPPPNPTGNGYLVFDGIDDFVDFPEGMLDVSTRSEFEFHFKLYGGTGAYQMLLDRWYTKKYGYAFFIDGDRTLYIRYGNYSANRIGIGLEYNVECKLKIVFNNGTVTVFVNGSPVYSGNYGSNNASVSDSRTSIGRRIIDGGTYPFYGEIHYVRINNGTEDIGIYEFNEEGNTAVDTSGKGNNGSIVGALWVGDVEPPNELPTPTIVSISAPTTDNTISDEPNMDIATVTFTFDQDVTEWRVRTIGTDHDTGILADSGGAVSAGTEITAEVDYTELYGEGQNRVNIYGKNADGQWTPYG